MSMTDRSSRNEERERLSLEEEQQRREDKERRFDDLQESWRRNHPSEQEENERDRRDKGRRA
jgi:hypothetical protein